MIDELFDAFIKIYTLFDVTLGRFCSKKDKDKVFTDLSNVFLINDVDVLLDVFKALESPFIQGAADRESYYLLCRAIAFRPSVVSETERRICIKKKDAITVYDAFFSPEPTSLGEALSMLYVASDSGKTNCMALLSFLLATGTFVRKNVRAAAKLTHDLARWNNIGGIMTGLSFIDDAQEEERYCAHLHAALSKNMQIDAVKLIRENFSEKYNPQAASLALELEKAFDRELEKRDTVNFVKLKVLDSVVFDDETKKKIILSSMNTAEIEKLPINIGARSRIFVDDAALCEKLGEKTDARYSRIVNNLALINAKKVKYKPLLVICNDSVRLRSIEHLLKSVFTKNPLSVLDFRNLSNCVFSRSCDNIVISTLEKNADAGTVIFMKNVDEIPKKDAEDFAVLLRRSNAEKFKLMYADVTLDVSGFIPVLFSTTKPCAEIFDACDAVELHKLSDEEKEEYLAGIIETMMGEYSLKEAPVITSEGKRRLLELEPEKMYDVVSRCCQMNVHRGKKIVISEETISELTAKGSQSDNRSWKR